jgi:hypothetical protein
MIVQEDPPCFGAEYKSINHIDKGGFGGDLQRRVEKKDSHMLLHS